MTAVPTDLEPAIRDWIAGLGLGMTQRVGTIDLIPLVHARASGEAADQTLDAARLSVYRSVRKTEQARHGDILVEVDPVDPDSASDEFPLCPLRRCGSVESWKRREGHRDHATVSQTDDQRIGGETHRLGTSCRRRANV
jgi:hypothetical protein